MNFQKKKNEQNKNSNKIREIKKKKTNIYLISS